MKIRFIEAGHPVTEENPNGGNHGKFMVAQFEPEEWAYRSALPGFPSPLLAGRGWSHRHLLFVDLQTGEGTFLRPHAGGRVHADLEKHKIWICPLAEPFLEWLYQQDLSDLDALPSYVELPDAEFAMAGYRRSGTPHPDPK